MKCPRCNSMVIESVVGIAGSTFRACATCYLPVDYFSLYEKHPHGGYACPFCDGLGQLPYTTSRVSPVRWGPCLYCHLDEYQDWLLAERPG